MMSPSKLKAALRQDIIGRRDALTVETRELASRAICTRLMAMPELAAVQRISAFWPLASEVDLRPLLETWCAAGKIAALPVMTGVTLRFLRWSRDSILVRKPFGVMEPASENEEIEPDIILVPLVGFDRSGARLGYGKGFYDRALAARRGASRPMTIGVAFAMQETAALPQEPHDQSLDLIVTEAEIIRVAER